MNNEKEHRTQEGLERQALLMAAIHCEGHEERCRRYRRFALVRRVVCVTLLMALSVHAAVSVATAATGRPAAEGVLSTDEAVADVHKTLINR